jgi:hypothetical protein
MTDPRGEFNLANGRFEREEMSSEPQTPWSREALRDVIAKHQRCYMPCACLYNSQWSDCAALADAILALSRHHRTATENIDGGQ